MGLFFLLIGLTALLVALIRRAPGMAMMGSLLALAGAFVVGVWLRESYLAETLGLLYVVAAVAVWAATPPPEERSEPLSTDARQELARIEELRRDRGRAPLNAVDPPDAESLGVLHHLGLAVWPAVGFGLAALGLPRTTAFVDGVWGALLMGRPGAGLAAAMTDVAFPFGLLWVFPGGDTVLVLPLLGLGIVLYQVARERPTAWSAFLEWSLVTLLLNGVALAALGLR